MADWRDAAWLTQGQRWLPVLAIVRDYRRDDFNADAMAGLVLGVVTVPQAVAYAVLAGMPPQAGLYACLLPMLMYALLGSSRQLIVGPVAVAALMVLTTVSPHAQPFTDHYVHVTAVLSVQVAIVLWLLRASGLAGLVNLLSQPVLVGFINAAVIMIVVSQIGPLLGLSGGSGNTVDRLLDAATHIEQMQPIAVMVSSTALLVLVAVPALLRRVLRPDASGADHPLTRVGPMLTCAGAAVAVWWFGLDLTHVGSLPSGLPELESPAWNPALWLALFPNAALIALVVFVESYSIGTSLAMRRGRQIDPGQELIALGAANLAAAFSSAYPVAGSFSRSSVNFNAGGRTPVSSFVCAFVIVITLFWFTPLFYHLPMAALAAIIVMSAIPMFELHLLRASLRHHRTEAAVILTTFFGVLLFNVEVGLAAGVIASIVAYLERTRRGEVTEVGQVGSSHQFRSVERYSVNTLPGVLALRIDESLHFANAHHLQEEIVRAIDARPECQDVLLSCSPVNYVDLDGLSVFEIINEVMRERGGRLHIADVKMPLGEHLGYTTLKKQLTGTWFFSADEAFAALAKNADDRVDLKETLNAGE